MIKMNTFYITRLSMIILITAMALPVAGFADEDETRNEVPSEAHMVFLNLRDGRIYQAIEPFFDRVGMQCRIDHYDFEEEPLDIEENQYQDMSEWEILKVKFIPHCIDIYSITDRYQVFVSKRKALPDDLREKCENDLSQVDETPRCVISILPYKPAIENHTWHAFFSPESLKASKMQANLPTKPLPDEKTGEYIYNEGLFVENFFGRVSGPTPVEPDWVLEKDWYEPKYLLPIKRLIFGVRQDNSKYLASIFLAEYDFVLDEKLFSPEHTPCAQAGMPILKQDLRQLLKSQ